MARPVNADATATRRRVLGAATRLFSQNGFAGTSVRSVANAAQVNVATIHHYFQSKELLYERCVDRMYEDLSGLRAELLPRLASHGDRPQAVVDLVVTAGYRFAREHRASLRLLMRTVIDRGEMDAQRRDEHQMPQLERAAELLGSLVERPRHELQLALQSVVHLVVRYALSTERELLAIAALPEETIDPHPYVEEHLKSAARSLLGLQEIPS